MPYFMYNKYIFNNSDNRCVRCRSVPVHVDLFCLVVIGVTSFWQTLRMRGVWLIFLTRVLSSPRLQQASVYTSVWGKCLMDRLYLQNLRCRLRYHRLLWRWRRSLFGSCAHPSVWSWHTSAPLLWSLHRHPCRTDRQEETATRREKQRQRRSREKRRRFDSHLFKGVSELLHADHPSCFLQQLWGHEVYKILKVNSAPN